MEGRRDIHDQVREVLGDDQGGWTGDGSQEARSDDSEIKTELVRLIRTYGERSSKWIHKERMYLQNALSELLMANGIDVVLRAIEELKIELQEVQISFPDYLNKENGELELAQAMRELPDYIERANELHRHRVERDELEQKQRSFFGRHQQT